MQRMVAVWGLAAALLSGLAWAAIDLSDFDDDLMRDMDNAIKTFEPNLSAKNAEGALADAEALNNGFVWTEEYFSAKGGADDAVKLSQEGQALVATATQAIKAKDFEAAATAARTAAKTCRSCHDVYKTTFSR
jgi:hypothetical protein